MYWLFTNVFISNVEQKVKVETIRVMRIEIRPERKKIKETEVKDL